MKVSGHEVLVWKLKVLIGLDLEKSLDYITDAVTLITVCAQFP